jgi:hypothetical protein
MADKRTGRPATPSKIVVAGLSTAAALGLVAAMEARVRPDPPPPTTIVRRVVVPSVEPQVQATVPASVQAAPSRFPDLPGPVGGASMEAAPEPGAVGPELPARPQPAPSAEPVPAPPPDTQSGGS